MVLGGIIIDAEDIQRVEKTFRSYRDQFNMKSELKWSKVKRQKLVEYTRFMEYFFALNNTDLVHFKCVIIDNNKVDHKKYSDGDKEKGFYKLYYQLLFHCFGKKYFKDDVKFIIHPDERTSSYQLGDLQQVLNRGMSKHLNKQVFPFIAIEPFDSKKSEIIQINDIILGAIGYQKNGYDLVAGSAIGKIELAKYIANSAGLKTLTDNTKWGKERFSIWNFQLK
jgi:hypothetical protein